MNPKFGQGCPDEQSLLDYLAGELDSEVARAVDRHLQVCTDCALRADQLSEDFADVERAVEAGLPLRPLRLAAARARLQERLESYEAGRIPEAGPVPVGATWARAALAAAVAILLAGAAAALFFPRNEQALTVEDALARAHRSVPMYDVRPSMARYQVDFVQLEPVPVARSLELVIWRDPGSAGYASRLQGADGSIRHAVWQRAADESAFAYDEVAGDTLVRIDRSDQAAQQPTLLASMGDGIDCDALARGFARWLERRRWHPLRVSHDFALLASDDATVRLERSGDMLLVVADKREGDLRAQVTLALSAGSFEPHWLQIHFRSPEGESTFRLVQNEVRFVAASHLDTAVFEARLPSSPVRSAAPVRRRPAPVRAGPDPRAIEARTRHALHRAGACLGEPVEVERGDDGTLSVRGIVGSAEMKEAILTALDRAGVADSVSVDIRTRAEAIGEAGARPDFDEIAVVQPGVGTDGPSAGGGAVRHVAVTAELTAYLRARDPSQSADSLGKDLGMFTEEAVERADDLLRRAWALRRLAQWYGHDTGESPPPGAEALVRTMCLDHLHGIAASARRSKDWTLPALFAIANSRGLEAGAPAEVSNRPAPAGSWSESFLSLYEAASSIHRDTVGLLTVRMQAAGVAGRARGQVDSPEPEDVDTTLHRLLESVRTFDARVTSAADAFVADADPVSAAPLGQGAAQ